MNTVQNLLLLPVRVTWNVSLAALIAAAFFVSWSIMLGTVAGALIAVFLVPCSLCWPLSGVHFFMPFWGDDLWVS